MKLSHYQIISVFFCYSRVCTSKLYHHGVSFDLSFSECSRQPWPFPRQTPYTTYYVLTTDDTLPTVLITDINRQTGTTSSRSDRYPSYLYTHPRLRRTPPIRHRFRCSDVPIRRFYKFIKPLVFRPYQGGCGSWFMCASVCKYGVRVRLPVSSSVEGWFPSWREREVCVCVELFPYAPLFREQFFL